MRRTSIVNYAANEAEARARAGISRLEGQAGTQAPRPAGAVVKEGNLPGR